MTGKSDRISDQRRNKIPIGWAIAVPGLLALAACGGNEQPRANEQPKDNAVVEGTVHVCSSCHGLDGRSISPTFPRLAGQQSGYIVAQLKAFRDHTRADPHAHTYMWGMAAQLSDATIEGLAAHYASQPPAPGASGDAGLMAAGKKIFEEGIPSREVPACMSCHGEQGQGADTTPRLASQHSGYIEEQLSNFTTMARANDVMHDNSKNLTAEEIRQIAAYVGSL
jgi:cytochrome c553